MGRRSISTTKAGKFMNPTDQASKKYLLFYFFFYSSISKIKIKKGKEACPKEFKKNQKQRLQVRQAVIKQKDPKNLLNDMELLDKMGELLFKKKEQFHLLLFVFVYIYKEFDSKNPPPYSVKVIQEKRRKLKETWTKIYQFYVRFVLKILR